MTIFRDTLRGLHNVFVFRHFHEIWFLDIFWQVYENYSRKTTKDRDVTFSPVVATCKFCQIRWYVVMWLHIELLQPISSKTKGVVLGEKARTGHIILQYSYTSDILVLNYLIWLINIHVNDSRQLWTHTYVSWLGIIFVVARPLWTNQTAISLKKHMQMKPSSTHHVLSIHLYNTPNLFKICSVVSEIQYIAVSE